MIFDKSTKIINNVVNYKYQFCFCLKLKMFKNTKGHKSTNLGKDSFNMDGTLPTDFAKSEIMDDSKILLKGLLNNLK